MNESLLLEKIAESLDLVEPYDLSIDVDFHNFDEWSSMAGMRMMATIEESYGVLLSPGEINSCKSIRHLLDIIKNKQNG
jgi:acyl carrier protein